MVLCSPAVQVELNWKHELLAFYLSELFHKPVNNVTDPKLIGGIRGCVFIIVNTHTSCKPLSVQSPKIVSETQEYLNYCS